MLRKEQMYLTVSEIISLLFFKQHEIVGGFRVPDAVLNSGRWAHERLGYNQTRKFSRYFKFNGEEWLVVGCPDRIEEGKVKELKTHTTQRARKDVLERAILQAQIYCWLTGCGEWEIIFYSLWSDEVSLVRSGEYDIQVVEKALRKAILLKKKLYEFQQEYQKLLKGGE